MSVHAHIVTDTHTQSHDQYDHHTRLLVELVLCNGFFQVNTWVLDVQTAATDLSRPFLTLQASSSSSC